jgi:hypothetical protein
MGGAEMKRALWKKIREYLLCTIAVLCLCAAGSDGVWFPWPNVIGTLILVMMAVIYHMKSQKRDILSNLAMMKGINSRLSSFASDCKKSQGTATTIRH